MATAAQSAKPAIPTLSKCANLAILILTPNPEVVLQGAAAQGVAVESLKVR